MGWRDSSGRGASAAWREHDVGVVAHHGPPVESDCEALSEVGETTLDPVSSMIEVAACERILTAQPGATDTPTDAVIEARFAGPDRSWRGDSP